MTITADGPQARAAATRTAPPRPAATRGAGPVPPAASPPRRRGLTPLTPMRQQAAKSMRRLAASVQQEHPDLTVHQHVRDAARTLESGNEEAAQRHLRAAMFALTPQSLYRNGIHVDDLHIAARQAMHGVHRHLLLVKDIADAGERNRAAIARHAAEDDTASPSLPPAGPHADPNAGYGPGALAQRPTARQPGGDRALNAPARTNSGGSDPAVADPVGPQPRGSKQFARTWDEVAAVLEMTAGVISLVGPKGYTHGWIYHGTKDMAPEDKADRMSRNISRKSFADGPDGHEALAAHREAAKAHRQAARLSSSPSAVAHHEKMARLHSAVAGGKMYSYNAAKQMGLAYGWDDLAAVIELAAGRPKASTW